MSTEKDNTYVIAEKDGMQRKFTRESWKLLNGNTNGWKPVQSSSVDNEKTQKTAPPDGQKNQPVENSIGNSTADEKTKADADAAKQAAEDAEVAELQKQEAELEKKKARVDAFTEAAKPVTMAQMKNYLDAQNVEYKANFDRGTLLNVAGDFLGWNVEGLKTAFNVES